MPRPICPPQTPTFISLRQILSYHDGVDGCGDSNDADQAVDGEAGDGFQGQARGVENHAQVGHHAQRVVEGGQKPDSPGVVSELQVLVDTGQPHLVENWYEEVAENEGCQGGCHQPGHREKPAVISDLSRVTWKSTQIS